MTAVRTNKFLNCQYLIPVKGERKTATKCGTTIRNKKCLELLKIHKMIDTCSTQFKLSMGKLHTCSEVGACS